MAELSKREINSIMDEWLKKELDDDENERILRGPKSLDDQMTLPLVYTDFLMEIDADLAYSDFSRVSGFVDCLLSERGITLKPDSLSYQTLCH